jgi:hypothetical protein
MHPDPLSNMYTVPILARCSARFSNFCASGSVLPIQCDLTKGSYNIFEPGSTHCWCIRYLSFNQVKSLFPYALKSAIYWLIGTFPGSTPSSERFVWFRCTDHVYHLSGRQDCQILTVISPPPPLQHSSEYKFREGLYNTMRSKIQF